MGPGSQPHTFLLMYNSHCVPAYSFVIPSSPMNVNANINSVLANYSSNGVSIPREGGNGYKISLFPHEMITVSLLYSLGLLDVWDHILLVL